MPGDGEEEPEGGAMPLILTPVLPGGGGSFGAIFSAALPKILFLSML